LRTPRRWRRRSPGATTSGARPRAARSREIATLARAVNRLTDELLENQRRLAENVRSLDETNQMLNEAQRDLVQAEKMASIGRLAAGVAHEIGNPLGALVGYIGVTRRRGVAARWWRGWSARRGGSTRSCAVSSTTPAR
jgi:C4-dicarboxylate-specific signal transduction histidine kinase